MTTSASLVGSTDTDCGPAWRLVHSGHLALLHVLTRMRVSYCRTNGNMGHVALLASVEAWPGHTGLCRGLARPYWL